MKKVNMARLREIIRREIIRVVVLSFIFELIVAITATLVYVGVVVSLVDYRQHGGGYPPFALAGISAAIGGIIFAIVQVDEDLSRLRRKLVSIGELYVFAAISFAAFGLFYPILDRMATPYEAYHIPFIAAVISLVAACASIVIASFLLISALWKKREMFLKKYVKDLFTK